MTNFSLCLVWHMCDQESCRYGEVLGRWFEDWHVQKFMSSFVDKKWRKSKEMFSVWNDHVYTCDNWELQDCAKKHVILEVLVQWLAKLLLSSAENQKCFCIVHRIKKFFCVFQRIETCICVVQQTKIIFVQRINEVQFYGSSSMADL